MTGPANTYPRGYFAWTPERSERLKSLIADGWSFQLIANDLGCTRNAAIGRAHRLKGYVYVKKPHPPRAKCQPKGGNRRKPSDPVLSGILSLRPISPRAIAKPRKMIPAGEPCGILDVTGCKYAIADAPKVPGGFLFCNAARPDDSAWCAEHFAICTQPAWGRFAMKRMGP